MASSDRVSVYVAATNLDAQFLVVLMNNEGIDAYCVEDNAPYGYFSFGTLDRIHRPEIFVPQDQVGKAKVFIDRYERGEIKESARLAGEYCYHCGSACAPDDAVCPSCGKSLEATSDDDTDSFEEKGGNSREQTSDASQLGLLRRLKWPLALFTLLFVTSPWWLSALLAWMQIVRSIALRFLM